MIKSTRLNVYNLRECVSAFVDMYCDELLNRNDTPAGGSEELAATLAIIHAVKSTRWSTLVDIPDVQNWYTAQLKLNGRVFSEFVERGYAFLLNHFVNEYAHDRIIELRTTSAIALNSTFVAIDSTEARQPTSKLMDHDGWMRVIEQFPWLMFLAILRNTYIDMGGDGEPPTQGGGNER